AMVGNAESLYGQGFRKAGAKLIPSVVRLSPGFSPGFQRSRAVLNSEEACGNSSAARLWFIGRPSSTGPKPTIKVRSLKPPLLQQWPHLGVAAAEVAEKLTALLAA